MTWDVRGDGKWRLNAGLARYVVGVNTAIVDAGSSGGRTATYSYRYLGPAINTAAAGPYVTADTALPQLFAWFNANGGTNLPTRTAPSIPGVTTKVAEGIKAPNSDEYSIGIAREIGNKGALRVDYVYRDYRDFYGDYRDMSTGKVSDPTGRVFDLVVVDNTNTIDRSYKGLSGQASYRFTPDLQVGGNYTLSWARGNFEGEDSGSGPVRASANDFPEYRREEWNYPEGYTNGDQRHKVRGWFNYALPVPEGLGRIDVGVLQRFDSSTGYDNTITVNPTPYMTNPGYISPTTSVTYYLSERGDLRRDGIYPHRPVDQLVAPAPRPGQGPGVLPGHRDEPVQPLARGRLQHDHPAPRHQLGVRGVQPLHRDPGAGRALGLRPAVRPGDGHERLPDPPDGQLLGRPPLLIPEGVTSFIAALIKT